MFFFKNPQPTTHNPQPSRGFTLVEMMAVIAIIGIVSGIVFGSISDSKARGRDSRRIADISVIQLALENYYDKHRKYPNLLSNLPGPIPTDPSTLSDYKYAALPPLCISSSSCQSYHLGATLEMDNPILNDDTFDKDSTAGIFYGSDDKGCDSETGHCYDVIPKF